MDIYPYILGLPLTKSVSGITIVENTESESTIPMKSLSEYKSE
jgi:hypothetical protein